MLQEKTPSQNIIDSLLDKISKEGKESLTDIEKKYLDQASSGDIDEKTEEDLLKAKEIDDQILSKLKADDHVSFEKVKKASQSVKDAYINQMIDDVFDSNKTKKTIAEEELELASQELIDKFVWLKTQRGNRLPPIYYKMASTDLVDKIIGLLVQRGEIIENDIIRAGSQKGIDYYVNIAASRGEYLSPGLLQKASEETKGEYLQKIKDKKGDEALRIYRDV